MNFFYYEMYLLLLFVLEEIQIWIWNNWKSSTSSSTPSTYFSGSSSSTSTNKKRKQRNPFIVSEFEGRRRSLGQQVSKHSISVSLFVTIHWVDYNSFLLLLTGIGGIHIFPSEKREARNYNRLTARLGEEIRKDEQQRYEFTTTVHK